MNTSHLPRVLGAVGRRTRKRAGLSAAELARRIGSHRPIVTRFEQGRHMPSLGWLARYADGCGSHLFVFTLAADRALGLA